MSRFVQKMLSAKIAPMSASSSLCSSMLTCVNFCLRIFSTSLLVHIFCDFSLDFAFKHWVLLFCDNLVVGGNICKRFVWTRDGAELWISEKNKALWGKNFYFKLTHGFEMPNDISEIIGKVLSESSKSYCHSELYHIPKTESEFSVFLLFIFSF